MFVSMFKAVSLKCSLVFWSMSDIISQKSSFVKFIIVTFSYATMNQVSDEASKTSQDRCNQEGGFVCAAA